MSGSRPANRNEPTTVHVDVWHPMDHSTRHRPPPVACGPDDAAARDAKYTLCSRPASSPLGLVGVGDASLIVGVLWGDAVAAALAFSNLSAEKRLSARWCRHDTSPIARTMSATMASRYARNISCIGSNCTLGTGSAYRT